MRITNRKINATLTISHRFVAIKKQEEGKEGGASNDRIVARYNAYKRAIVIVFRFIHAIHKLKNKAISEDRFDLATMFGRQTSGGTILQRTTYRIECHYRLDVDKQAFFPPSSSSSSYSTSSMNSFNKSCRSVSNFCRSNRTKYNQIDKSLYFN